MDERALGPIEGPFQRARLHIRGGKRRLRQEKISAGIVTLYDALLAAMESYVNSPEHKGSLVIKEGDDLKDERTVYAVLVRSGVLDGTFEFETFERLMERALNEEMPGYDYRDLLQGIERVMYQLGVMPFDDADLPPEDPKTY
ncbi:MAG TPA: hypothetical protein VL087_07965 [Nitrospirota bacterium]|nr:hypothetical protein [Nitrospirota bacterium]